MNTYRQFFKAALHTFAHPAFFRKTHQKKVAGNDNDRFVFALLLDLFEVILYIFATLLTLEAIAPGLFFSPISSAISLTLLTISFAALIQRGIRLDIAIPLSIRRRSPILWVGIMWLTFTLTLSLLPPISWIPLVTIAVSAGIGFIFRKLFFNKKKTRR